MSDEDDVTQIKKKSNIDDSHISEGICTCMYMYVSIHTINENYNVHSTLEVHKTANPDKQAI